MDIGFLLGVIGGPLLIIAGARQIWPIVPLLRSGVRATGTVVRLDRTWEKEESVWLYAPVVVFRDEAGAEHDRRHRVPAGRGEHDHGPP
ncbi:hypothetical protein [Symbioplanes lichenis]|uniref:hypothetical protein n=1 Tax=Symbioplanes lichenis TaxID=1629072 RepID=UPI00273844E1|nr:hypothetical protein [Actinoplanes lichenis]